MHRFMLLVPVILPVFFWAAYHYHKDRQLPEPIPKLALAFVLGVLAAGVSQSMYLALQPLGLRFDALLLADTNSMALFAYSLLAIGPIEELSKLLLFVLVVVRFREFDDPLDGIIYASFLGLGYAAVENWQYLDYLGPLEAAARGFASPVVHILFASVWGYRVGRARLGGHSVVGAAATGLLIAAGLHGLYDFMVLLQPFSALPCAALLIATLWVWRLRLMRQIHDRTRLASIATNDD